MFREKVKVVVAAIILKIALRGWVTLMNVLPLRSWRTGLVHTGSGFMVGDLIRVAMGKGDDRYYEKEDDKKRKPATDFHFCANIVTNAGGFFKARDAWNMAENDHLGQFVIVEGVGRAPSFPPSWWSGPETRFQAALMRQELSLRYFCIAAGCRAPCHASQLRGAKIRGKPRPTKGNDEVASRNLAPEGFFM